MEDQSADQGTPGGAGECTEECANCACVGHAGQCAEGVNDVPHHPAAEDSVVCFSQHCAKDAQITHPGEAAADLLVGHDSCGLAVTADQEVSHQHADTDNNHTDDVDEQECCAAVSTGHVGELHDVAQTDCGTGSSQNEAKSAAPLLTGLVSSFLRH